MSKRMVVSQFNLGIKSMPASTKGGQKGASLMRNLVITKDGYLEDEGGLSLIHI